MRIKELLMVAVAAFMLTGCVSYSGSTLHSLADKNRTATEVTSSMCADFGLASQAAMHGDDKAWPVLGKAQQMKQLSVALSKHSIQCYETVKRINREVRPLSDMNHGAILSSFKQSWAHTKAISGVEVEGVPTSP